ncbi:TIGR03089 family protein [Kineococcus glutinatus]|uniref:TIGR03089 family protein n=1 Tax=Kineococcus glutinatus TaxID=1070872 RepID=A0ABP8VLS5_9ACTN
MASPSSAPAVPPSLPPSVAELLRRLVAADPTRPRLTFYGPRHADDGERVELSARVLDTWVSKTANLLVEEFDAGPGSTVALDLPAHWRALVWQLAAWSVGAGVVVGDGAGGGVAAGADVLVTADAATAAAAAGDGVVVALAPLAAAYPAGAPAGVLDYARVITGYGDVFRPHAAPEPAAAARTARSATTSFGDLLPAALAAGAAWPVGVRLLTDASPAAVVGSVLAAYVRGGSVVLAPALDALPAAVREQELVTAVLATQG